METFKLSKDARLAFNQKLVNNKFLAAQEEPYAFQLKQEIKTEPTMDSAVQIEPNMLLIKQENIKTERTYFRFDPDPQHDITSLFSETENKHLINRNECTSSNSSLDFSTKPKSKTFPRKKHARQRRAPMLATAIRVHRYLSSQNPDSLTQKQIDSLNWAERVLTGSTSRRMNNDSVLPPPIDITNDGHNELNEAFIHDETVHEIPETFQLAVVDFANPGGRYSLANARLIEKTLSKAVITYILENPEAKTPIFGKSIYFDGVLVLDCKDQAAYDFAKLILCDKKIWDGSRLKIMEPQKAPFDSIGSLHAPDVGIDKNNVLDVLKAQNPSINMHNWKMLGETPFKSGHKQYSIKMCNPPVYFQKHKQLRLFFGGSEVVLKNFGCEWLWNCRI